MPIRSQWGNGLLGRGANNGIPPSVWGALNNVSRGCSIDTTPYEHSLTHPKVGGGGGGVGGGGPGGRGGG